MIKKDDWNEIQINSIILLLTTLYADIFDKFIRINLKTAWNRSYYIIASYDGKFYTEIDLINNENNIEKIDEILQYINREHNINESIDESNRKDLIEEHINAFIELLKNRDNIDPKFDLEGNIIPNPAQEVISKLITRYNHISKFLKYDLNNANNEYESIRLALKMLGDIIIEKEEINDLDTFLKKEFESITSLSFYKKNATKNWIFREKKEENIDLEKLKARLITIALLNPQLEADLFISNHMDNTITMAYPDPQNNIIDRVIFLHNREGCDDEFKLYRKRLFKDILSNEKFFSNIGYKYNFITNLKEKNILSNLWSSEYDFKEFFEDIILGQNFYDELNFGNNKKIISTVILNIAMINGIKSGFPKFDKLSEKLSLLSQKNRKKVVIDAFDNNYDIVCDNPNFVFSILNKYIKETGLEI